MSVIPMVQAARRAAWVEQERTRIPVPVNCIRCGRGRVLRRSSAVVSFECDLCQAMMTPQMFRNPKRL